MTMKMNIGTTVTREPSIKRNRYISIFRRVRLPPGYSDSESRCPFCKSRCISGVIKTCQENIDKRTLVDEDDPNIQCKECGMCW